MAPLPDSTQPTTTQPLKPGNDKVRSALEARNYELLGELGRGGMGVVYLAQHRKLGRRVAIKTLTPDRATKENSILRFQREAKTFAAIRHPHIANLYEYEDTGAVQYLALEYIEGTDLEKERKRNHRWKAEEVAKMIASVADALDHTHKKGILHRDIKPGNILIERNTNRVVLTDFGLAKAEQDETLTANGFAVGTPAYMAPEQITDQFGGKPDGRADIFSLGTVAYEMLTMQHPFLAADDLNTMRNIVNGKLKPLREAAPQTPEALARIVEWMMARNPKDRVPDAATLAKALNDWLSGKEAQAPATPAVVAPAPKSGPGSASATVPEVRPAPAKAAAPATAPAPQPPPAAPSGGVSTQTLIIVVAASVVVTAIIAGAIAFVLFAK